ncbi:MAG: hypothetical protein KHY83_09305 [Coriobacteriia bacterium]|nr:hypothetical protein [Coriobacteriia bacterium]MBS5478843.1 hypothetical protein [Coriobacteriia bacterium]
MDPVLADVYSTALSSAPFVIAAYALIWIILMAFAIAMFIKSRKTQKDIDALKEAIERRERKQRP